jgi:hypothetical protein
VYAAGREPRHIRFESSRVIRPFAYGQSTDAPFDHKHHVQIEMALPELLELFAVDDVRFRPNGMMKKISRGQVRSVRYQATLIIGVTPTPPPIKTTLSALSPVKVNFPMVR